MTARLTAHFIVHGDFTHIDRALTTLAAHTQTPHQVMVTINQGPPAAIDALRRDHPHVAFIVNPTPRGFAANHNAILRRAETPYVALLNDDIAVHPGALDTLVAHLDAHQDVGLVGPQILNPDGTPQLSTFSDLSLGRALYKVSGLGHLTPHGGAVRRLLARLGVASRLGVESLKDERVTRDVPVVVGVAMLARRRAYQQAGVMDEDTRIYGEEDGWHWRLRQAGWRVVFVPAAAITHYNPKGDLSGWKLAEQRQALLALFTRYRAPWQAVALRLGMVMCHSLYMLLNLGWRPAESRAHRLALRMALTWRLHDQTPPEEASP